MPRTDRTSEAIQDEGERLFLEQAKAYYRDLRRAAQDAPYGQVIRHVELLSLQRGREFIRRSAEQIVQEQNDLLEKKKNSGNAPADTPGNTAATIRTTS